jgi:hypothetical protein
MPKQLYIPLPDANARREMVLRQVWGRVWRERAPLRGARLGLPGAMRRGGVHELPLPPAHSTPAPHLNARSTAAASSTRQRLHDVPPTQLGPGGGINAALSPSDVDKLVGKTDGYSGSDMRNLIQASRAKGAARARVCVCVGGTRP